MLAGVLAAPVSVAQPAGLGDCRAIVDPAQRLACYDRLAGAPAGGPDSAAPAAPVADMPPAAPAEQVPSAPAREGGVPPAPAPESAAPPPAAAPASARSPAAASAPAARPPAPAPDPDGFGAEQLPEKTAAEERAPDQIESRIVGEFSGWSGRTRFRLENGQVWQQAENDTYYWREDNPEVVIRKGVFGSYKLRIRGQNRWVRVRRIE